MALLGWGPGRIVIVFRGTNSLKNVVADLQVQPQSPGIANGMCAPSITPCSIQHCNWHASLLPMQGIRWQCRSRQLADKRCRMQCALVPFLDGPVGSWQPQCEATLHGNIFACAALPPRQAAPLLAGQGLMASAAFYCLQ